MWFIYIIESEKGKLYTGITNNLLRRFHQHRRKKGAKFFWPDPPKQVRYWELTETKSQALKREWQIKKLNRSQKLDLIEGRSNKPNYSDL